MTNQEQYEIICEKAKKYDRLVEILDKIKTEINTEIQKMYMFRDYTNGLAKVLEIIDKYKIESEE